MPAPAPSRLAQGGAGGRGGHGEGFPHRAVKQPAGSRVQEVPVPFLQIINRSVILAERDPLVFKLPVMFGVCLGNSATNW